MALKSAVRFQSLDSRASRPFKYALPNDGSSNAVQCRVNDPKGRNRTSSRAGLSCAQHTPLEAPGGRLFPIFPPNRHCAPRRWDPRRATTNQRVSGVSPNVTALAMAPGRAMTPLAPGRERTRPNDHPLPQIRQCESSCLEFLPIATHARLCTPVSTSNLVLSS